MLKLPETLKLSSIFVLFFTLTSLNPQLISSFFQGKVSSETSPQTESTTTEIIVPKNNFADQANLHLLELAQSLGIASEMSQKPQVGSLWQEENTFLNLDLKSGKSYAILGVCDRDCEDIDLTLYDSQGNIIDYDTASDNTPLVNVMPKEGENLQIKIKMSSCAIAPCYYGIGVFARSL